MGRRPSGVAGALNVARGLGGAIAVLRVGRTEADDRRIAASVQDGFDRAGLRRLG